MSVWVEWSGFTVKGEVDSLVNEDIKEMLISNNLTLRTQVLLYYDLLGFTGFMGDVVV